jgi:NAD(P)-dependent dehydrogenase (short-subunit alcohol dehydrogenase family)
MVGMKSLELFNLSGRTALVTGGGRGIGKTIAQALAEAGADIAIGSRNKETCAAAASEIGDKTGRSFISGELDVSNGESVNAFVKTVTDRFGTVDVLVNNSGATWGAQFEDMPLEKWDKVVGVNLTGTFLMCKAIAPFMKRRGWGRIINVASVSGLLGSPEFMHAVGYTASKGGVIALTKELAVKLARHGIVVNAVAPGFFPTKMSRMLTDTFGEQIRKAVPLGRMGEEDDLKGVAVFLASEASRYVTGQVIPVDGGHTAW